ncbi:MAG: TPR repeat protein [Sulfurimonas sp.]|jgi:TPR repeat protein|uniref:tetratricopeptide repeat protein n=1 Tax=Sulfurimonas sp. TaxID=2022749 RepID=UPI0039E54DBB
MKKLFYTLCIILITNLGASSPDEERILLEKSCKKGNTLACHEIKLMYGEGSVATLKKESFKEACEEGNPIACHNMGLMYDYGDDAVLENDNIAIDFYIKACDKNYYESCTRAAFLYEEGTDVEVNMKKAFKLYSKSCGGDDGLACHNVAVYYGKNENETLKKLAINFYDKACDNGSIDSCIFMGRYYRDSKSLRQNYVKAKKKFEKACELNNALGCKEVRILKGAGY